jgi:hypothetical protein
MYVNRQFNNVRIKQYMQWDLLKRHRAALDFYSDILSKLVYCNNIKVT